MKTIAIANRKGGVGKTSTVINLGAALNQLGRTILLIDMDSQGDLSAHCGLDADEIELTIYDVLIEGTPITDSIQHIETEHGIAFDLVPANSAMENLVYDLESGEQTRLRDALATVQSQYDYILIDCPPAANIATIQALTACDNAILPAPASFLGLRGLMGMSELIVDIKADLNPRISIAGILLTNYNPRNRHQLDIRSAIEDALPGMLFDTGISTATAVAEASAAGTDIYTYADVINRTRKAAKPLVQYQELAHELERRIH